MNAKKSLSFYIEIFVLLAVLLAASTVLVRTLGEASSMSRDAAQLTSAVRLAQNAAEKFAADTNTTPNNVVLVWYDKNGQPSDEGSGMYAVRTRTDSAEDAVLHAEIAVLRDGTELYTLQTAKALLPTAGDKEEGEVNTTNAATN